MAIREVERHVGVVESGQVGDCIYRAGKLQVGEAMPTPLIREVKKSVPPEGHVIFDAPPGTSCSVVETVNDSDFVLLVTEPTPFGLNDLKLAVEVVRKLGLRYAVLLNRANSGDDRVHDYCRNEAIELIAEIPDDRLIAEAYSRGELIIHALPEYRTLFGRVLRIMENRVRNYVANGLNT
jgi:MinD superfamily P-loop ATPase